MKPWMAIVIVVATLAVGLAIMAPRRDASGSDSSKGGSVGSAATDEKIAVISSGKKVEIAEHLKEGRFTIVEFTADW